MAQNQGPTQGAQPVVFNLYFGGMQQGPPEASVPEPQFGKGQGKAQHQPGQKKSSMAKPVPTGPKSEAYHAHLAMDHHIRDHRHQ